MRESESGPRVERDDPRNAGKMNTVKRVPVLAGDDPRNAGKILTDLRLCYRPNLILFMRNNHDLIELGYPCIFVVSYKDIARFRFCVLVSHQRFPLVLY